MTSIIKVNNLQNQCGANTINKCGTAITVGASGDTVTLAAGASQSGFGQTYSAVSWDTTPKTGLFTAVSGVGYFCNTTSAPFTVTLPAGTAGDIVAFADYAGTWQTNNVTVAPNGTDKIGSLNENATLNTEGQSVTFVFVDSTQGWINTMDSTSNVRGLSPFIEATVSGACNTLTTVDTDYKVAKFVGPGSFTVTSVSPTVPTAQQSVDYMVIAGGGGGGYYNAGGAGAGGFRESKCSSVSGCWTASPLSTPTSIQVSAQAYPIVIGGGGPSAGPGPVTGTQGNNSSALSITSTGGGYGNGSVSGVGSGGSGGSGGGAGGTAPGGSGGAGNTPPVSPPQ